MLNFLRFRLFASGSIDGLGVRGLVQKQRSRIVSLFVLLLLGLSCFGKIAISILQANSDHYSHIRVIYLIIGYILFTERKKIFGEIYYSPVYGIVVMLTGSILFFYFKVNRSIFSPNDYASALSFAFAVYMAGIFLCCFGLQAFQEAKFAVFLLLFTIPIPDFVMDHAIDFLQLQSYNAACWVLDALQLYPIKEGFSLIFPDVSVEVAKQCSGIRSSIALLIVSVLYGHYFLKTNAGRVLLVFLTLFVAPFKNGLRIATLVLLSIYWDKKVLASPIHTAGGIPFFGVGLAWLSLILFLLAKLERFLLNKFSNGGTGIGS
jgi:exosortase